MSMKDTLKKAKIAAMKAKDKAKLNPINLTLADIQNLEIANGHEATDEEVLKVIQKGVKTRRETAKLKGVPRDWPTRPPPKPPRRISWKPSRRRVPPMRITPRPSLMPWRRSRQAPRIWVVSSRRPAPLLRGKTIDGGKLAGLV